MAFTKDLSDVKVTRLPGTAAFQCELSKANVPVTWYKDGEQIRKNPRYSIETEGRIHRLTVKHVENADEGTFSCLAKNVRTSGKLSIQS
jgi:titin